MGIGDDDSVWQRKSMCKRERERACEERQRERESHDYEKMRGVRKDKKG